MAFMYISPLLMKGPYTFALNRCKQDTMLVFQSTVPVNVYSDSSEWIAPGTLSKRLQNSRPTLVACGLLVRSSFPHSAPLALVSAFGSAAVIGRPENPVVVAWCSATERAA